MAKRRTPAQRAASRKNLAKARSARAKAAGGARYAQLSRIRSGIERRSRAKYKKAGPFASSAKVQSITNDTSRRLVKLKESTGKVVRSRLIPKSQR